MSLLFGAISLVGGSATHVEFSTPSHVAGIPGSLSYEVHREGGAVLGVGNSTPGESAGFQSLYQRGEKESFLFRGRGPVDATTGVEYDPAWRGYRHLTRCLRAGDDVAMDALPAGFSLALWDRRDRRLLLARDHHGPAELFYRRQGDLLCFSSSLPFLLAQAPVAGPDLLTTAFLLTGLSDGDGSRTFFDSVRQIPPGHLLRATPQGLSLHRYWSPWNVTSEGAKREKDTLAEFHEVFDGAIQRALQGAKRPAIMLSGGLDSGAVGLTASRLLAARGERLLAYTAIPELDADAFLPALRQGNESQSAGAIAARAPNMVHHCLTPKRVTPLAGGSELLSVLGHPVFGAVNGDWLLCLLRRAQTDGADVMLTGQCGNATISWTGSRVRLIRRFFGQGRLGAIGAEWRGFRAVRSASMIRALRSVILAPMVPWTQVHRLMARRATRDGFLERSAIRADRVRELDLFDRSRNMLEVARNAHHKRHRDAILQTGVYAPNAFNARLASSFGLRLEDPTADRQVIEFCYGLSDEAYISLGRNRMLIRRAMDGQLPDGVLWPRKTGVQSADVVLRVRESRSEIEEALGAAECSESARWLLDVGRMRDVFVAALHREGDEIRDRTASVLLRGLMTAEFLRRYD